MSDITSAITDVAEEGMSFLGIGFMEDEIDDVIFQTNQFLLNADFIGQSGPFWWILQMSMCLGALFAIIMAAGMTYKMQIRHEPLDALKIIRALGISLIMIFWYPPSVTGIGPTHVNGSFLSILSYIPNCLGSYTNSLYETEATQVQQRYDEVVPYLKQLGDSVAAKKENYSFLIDKIKNVDDTALDVGTAEDMKAQEKEITAQYAKVVTAGTVVFLDKILMFLALVIYRIGWWATMYCQQILLGMLTIFGPIQWAFSLLPKWEGSWAKWTTRYLTVHLYGMMLYFVIFRRFLTFCKSDVFHVKKSATQQTCTKSVPKITVPNLRLYTTIKTRCEGNKKSRDYFYFISLFFPRNKIVGFIDFLMSVKTLFTDSFKSNKIYVNRRFQTNYNILYIYNN